MKTDIFIFYGRDRRFKDRVPKRSRYLVFRTEKTVDSVVSIFNDYLSKKSVSCTDSYLRDLLINCARRNQIEVLSHSARISLKQGDVSVDGEKKFIVRNIDRTMKEGDKRESSKILPGRIQPTDGKEIHMKQRKKRQQIIRSDEICPVCHRGHKNKESGPFCFHCDTCWFEACNYCDEPTDYMMKIVKDSLEKFYKKYKGYKKT